MEHAHSGKVVVVSGPSAVGKTTVLERVLERSPAPLVRSVSATTRDPRGVELDGVDYHFFTPEEFARRKEKGEFLEAFEVYGRGFWYGTLWSEVDRGLKAGKWVALNIDVNGAQAVMDRFPDAITIFVRPPSEEELRRRLEVRRTESPEAIRRRLEHAQGELAMAKNYRYQVVNDDLDRAVDEVCKILAENLYT